MNNKLARLLPSLLFVAIAIPSIERPGIQYDEILFGNAALGNLDGTFVRSEVAGVPVLLMQYIGALKAYLYYPIFELFGVSPLSIRLPMILVFAIGIQFVYAIYNRIGVRFALALSALFALQPSLVLFARADVGPIVIETFLKLAILYVLVSTHSAKDYRKVVLISVLCLLGVFNKLNFIWFANAALGAFLAIVCFQGARHCMRTKSIEVTCRRNLITGALVFAPSLIYFLVINNAYGLSSSFDLTVFMAELPKKVDQFYEVLTGSSFSKSATELPVSGYGKVFALYSASIVTGGFVCFLRVQEKLKAFRIAYLFLVLVGLFTVMQILYTSRAINPWHALSIEPVYSIIVGLSVWFIYVFLSSKWSFRISRTLAYSIVCVFALFDGSFLYRNYKSILDDDGKRAWSVAIYDLIEYAKTNEGIFYSADWGFHTQLITFIQNPDKVKDALPFLNEFRPDEEIAIFERETFLESDSPVFFIFHPDSDALFPEIKSDIYAMAARNGADLVLHEQLADSKDRIRYEIFRLRPRALVVPD